MVTEKRPAEEASRPNKRARQREVKRAVHQISVQHADATKAAASAGQSGESSSVTAIRLPTQINVEERLSTLRYETQALLKAIRTSSTGSSVRAWQMLPRDKRRRNASHNLLALPKRLRAKGRSELRASNTAARTRSQTRRRRGKGHRAALGAYPRRKDGKRRQTLIVRATNAAAQGRTWLETHLWHAKRFRMSSRQPKLVAGKPVAMPERWGFDLPEESSAKSFRSSWRDAKKSVTIADRSYDAWLRITSTVRRTENISQARWALGYVLERSGLLAGWQLDMQTGKRFCDTLLAGTVSEAKGKAEASSDVPLWRGLAPVQVIWVKPAVETLKRPRCELLLRTHPSCVAQVERAVRKAILPVVRKWPDTVHARIDISRLNNVAHPLITAGSGAVGRRHGGVRRRRRRRRRVERASSAAEVFEDALQRAWLRQQAFNVFELEGPSTGALLAKVLVRVNGENPQELANTLRGGKAQAGDVIYANVHDPRLSFPPRSRALKGAHGNANSDEVVTESARLLADGAPLPRYSGGEIQSRRAGLPTPGARLLPSSRDDVVPIVLLCHGEHQWTLLLPRGWAKAFWLSLVYPGTRVLGQKQIHVLRFDRRMPTFPYDWPGTAAFEAIDETESQRAFDRWQRTPPAKRINFDRTGARWPFGGPGMWHELVQNGFVASTAFAERPLARPPWLFALSDVRQLDPFVEAMKRVSDDVVEPDTLPWMLAGLRSALLCVSLVACRKGSFDRWDEVHMLLSNDEQHAWTSALQAVQGSKHERKSLQRLEQRGFHRGSQSHVGSVTTAHFNLSNGTGSAIGAVSLLAYLRIASRQAKRIERDENKICRNPIDSTNLVLIISTSGAPARAASMKPLLLT